jgi:hypothetical protein
VTSSATLPPVHRPQAALSQAGNWIAVSTFDIANLKTATVKGKYSILDEEITKMENVPTRSRKIDCLLNLRSYKTRPTLVRLHGPGARRTSFSRRMATGHRWLFGQRMNVSKRIIAGVVVTAVVASLTMMALPTKDERSHRVVPVTKDTQKTEKISKSGVVATVVEPVSAPTVAVAQLTTRPTPPAELATWFSMTESQRLDLVTELSHDPALKSEVVAFLRSVIQDRERGLVTRNNAANALVAQETKDPTLAAVFKRMVEDVSEDESWRDYSLQFLAVSIDWSNDPEAMAATIWQMATNGPGSIPGTALLHLHYIDQRGVALLPSGYEEYLSKLLAQENADLPSRMTVAGIAGQRGMIELAPQLRNVAEHASQPALRRVALAALGQINDPADVVFVQRFTNDSDVLIAAAAKSAKKRLLAGNQKTSLTKP